MREYNVGSQLADVPNCEAHLDPKAREISPSRRGSRGLFWFRTLNPGPGRNPVVSAQTPLRRQDLPRDARYCRLKWHKTGYPIYVLASRNSDSRPSLRKINYLVLRTGGRNGHGCACPAPPPAHLPDAPDPKRRAPHLPQPQSRLHTNQSPFRPFLKPPFQTSRTIEPSPGIHVSRLLGSPNLTPLTPMIPHAHAPIGSSEPHRQPPHLCVNGRILPELCSCGGSVHLPNPLSCCVWESLHSKRSFASTHTLPNPSPHPVGSLRLSRLTRPTPVL